jgi:hypothetical protein
MTPGRNLPDFIAVGPPRTATTWLDQVLRGHVSLPEGIKETNFFAWNFPRGLAWYQSHFKSVPPGRPIVEVCPQYFDHPEARVRIAEYLPRCRIICTFRDPVERLYSHYRHLRCTGWIPAVGFEEAMELHRAWSGPGNMLGASIYSTHLRAWLNSFGKENVLVLLNDDLDRDRQEYLNQLCAFLGIPAIDVSRSPLRIERTNARPRTPRSARLARRAREVRDFLRSHRYYRVTEGLKPLWNFCYGGGEEFAPLDPALESRLRDCFRPDVEALEKLLQRDLSAWK